MHYPVIQFSIEGIYTFHMEPLKEISLRLVFLGDWTNQHNFEFDTQFKPLLNITSFPTGFKNKFLSMKQ